MSTPALPHATPRLRLRRLGVHDLASFQAYRGDAELARYQGWQAQDDAAALAFLQQMAASPWCPPGAWFQIGIAAPDISAPGSDTLIGDIGLHLHADGAAAEIGFTLSRAAQGRGLGTEAVGAAIDLLFSHTPALRVLGITDARNTASVRLLQRVGMKRYTTLDTVFRGQPCVERFFVRHRQPLAPPTLRAAVADDAAAVARVLIEARRELMPFAPSTHDDADLRRWVARELIPSGGVTVAQVQDGVAGVLAVSQTPQAAWIDQLHVHPTCIGAGVGHLLLAHALSTLPRPLQLYTFQANYHARAFYERHGFVAVVFSDGSTNEERCPDVMYRLGAASGPSRPRQPGLRSGT